MELGVLLFPVPGGAAQLARVIKGLGFDSLVFADTQKRYTSSSTLMVMFLINSQ